MGFWNALSVLAPVAPALSDAQDIRTARQRDTTSFAQDTDLKNAQLLAQRLAAENTQQENNRQQVVQQQLGVPLRKYKGADGADYTDYFTPTGVKSLPDAPSNEAKFKNYIDSLDKLGVPLTPEQKAVVSPEFFGGRAMPSAKFTPLTGAAGQPQEYPKGSGMFVVHGKDENGNLVSKPVDAGYVPPAPKSLPPATQYLQLYTKKLLADSKQGPPLTPEENAGLIASKSAMDEPGISRMQELGRQYAQYHITPITDDSGAAVVVPIDTVLAANKAGAPPRTAAAGTASGADKNRQALASSAIQQVNRMERILAHDPGMTGPGTGQLTALQTWLGNQDPDAQAFLMSSLINSEHGVAVFGGRNIHTIQDLQNTIGSWKTNPAALKAALEVIRETMTPFLIANNRLVAPTTPGSGVGGTGGGGAPKTANDYLNSVGYKPKAKTPGAS